MNRVSFIITLLVIVFKGYGQTTNGTVSSLVAAENYFAATVKEKGQREGFLRVSDAETIIFRPDPVKAELFYDKKQDDPGELIWEPSFAKISKSGDWGFTTGPFVYTDFKSDSKSYGQYLSVWRANKKGVWKLAIDIGSPHPKPEKEPELKFTDPQSGRFFRQISQARLKQRVDMILTTDKLFGTTLRKNTALAYDSFIADNARLIFPGSLPIEGKDKIQAFYSKEGIQIETEVTNADRSIGSDLAYSYGVARITRNGVVSKYNYIRIWETQEGYKWNVIVELFSPTE